MEGEGRDRAGGKGNHDMNEMTINAETLINVLKAQRNNALDAVAMLEARMSALNKENAELRAKLKEKDAPSSDSRS